MTIFFGAVFILLGLFFLYHKYRIIFGGTPHKATVIRCEMMPGGRGSYVPIVRFNHGSKRLEKPVAVTAIFFFPRRQVGKVYSIYYNARHPKFVARRGLRWDLLSIFFIVAGVIMIAANAWP